MGLDDSWDCVAVLAEDLNFQMARESYTESFLQLFNMGYQNYFEGEWLIARSLLSVTRTMLMLGHDDGPSVALLRFMEQSHNFEASKHWHGVRDLKPEQFQNRQHRTSESFKRISNRRRSRNSLHDRPLR